MKKIFLTIVLLLLFSSVVIAKIKPEDVIIVANSNEYASLRIADYYAKKRGIPKKHILKLLLPTREDISYEEFLRFKAAVRKFLTEEKLDKKIKCIVLAYRVPLKITSKGSPLHPAILHAFKEVPKNHISQLSMLKKETEDSAKEKSNKDQKSKDNNSEKRTRNEQTSTFKSSVDSELSLLWRDEYRIEGFLRNPLYGKNGPLQADIVPQKVIMVSRLDGATPEIVYRIIDDASEAESKRELSGTVYLDARGIDAKGSYGTYDESIRKSARFFSKYTSLPVVLDNKPKLFGENSAPDALFYCGWYSLMKYVDSFGWNKGSVGYHLASGEAASLRRGNYWCKRMLDEGITATLGPVTEPFIGAFPQPAYFFHLLLFGNNTLVEAYYKSLPYVSWQMVLIGDPLYTITTVPGPYDDLPEFYKEYRLIPLVFRGEKKNRPRLFVDFDDED